MGQIIGGDFAKFVGLFRIYELYTYLFKWLLPTLICCTTIKKAKEKENYFESFHFFLKRQGSTKSFISLFWFPPNKTHLFLDMKLKVKNLVFCYQNCSDLLWLIVLVIENIFWNLRLKAENLKNVWDHSNNLFKQWKVRTIFGNAMLFQIVPEGFSDIMN